MSMIDVLRIPSTIAGAIEVMCGIHGVNPERKESLTKSGYDAERVQACVDEFAEIWNKYGGD